MMLLAGCNKGIAAEACSYEKRDSLVRSQNVQSNGIGQSPPYE